MSALSKVLGSSVPHEFIHRDKTYKVSCINHAIKCAFERKLFARAKDALAQMKDILTPKEYEDRLDKLNDEYFDGEYSLESVRGQKALQSVQGMLSLVAL